MLAACLRTILLALALAAGGAFAQENPAGPPVRVLFIGNSLTYTTDLPQRIAGVAKATGRAVQVESVAYPSFSLEDHWQDGRALEAIRKGGWDYVVLQQGTSAHEEGRAQLVEFAKRFAQPIRTAGAKPALYMVWPLADRPKDFPATIQSYRLAAKAIDAVLLPAGEAWFRVLSQAPRTRLYADGIHPSSLGSDLAAVTIYLSLFPAGPQEFDDAFIGKIARALEMDERLRDRFIDAATRAIDEPIAIR
ncbi:MAG: SGNH/GDSL hydrolase family protein [Betaproteobacteria bacterium]|nr:SGNH/GDSL hydrolase family protein [Betaproteobacteria bacterium]